MTRTSYVSDSSNDPLFGFEKAYEMLREVARGDTFQYYLDQTQKELEVIHVDHNRSAWDEFCTFWEGLGEQQVSALRAAVRLYTTDKVYYQFNRAFRSGNSAKFRGFSTLLRRALKAVPYYRGSTVFRGTTIKDYDSYTPGLVYRWPFFVSASANQKQTQKFGPVLFTIQISEIFSISQISRYSVCPWEEEILFHPYTRFEVIEKRNNRVTVEICTKGSGFDLA
jgi:hypothetical protein